MPLVLTNINLRPLPNPILDLLAFRILGALAAMIIHGLNLYLLPDDLLLLILGNQCLSLLWVQGVEVVVHEGFHLQLPVNLGGLRVGVAVGGDVFYYLFARFEKVTGGHCR